MCSATSRLHTMGPWLPALLCLGLYLSHKTGAENETLPRPQIIFETGSVTMMGHPVSIRCRGPKEAQVFILQKKEDKDFEQTEHSIWNEALFSFSHMEDTMAGHYSCSYQAASGMSPPSETVMLAVAGLILKPFLVTDPRPQAVLGKPLFFKCWSDQKLDRLIVYQDEGLIPPMYRFALESEIEISFPKAQDKHTGIYSCIGYASKDPLKWSKPSDPLLLIVSRSQGLTARITVPVVLLVLGTLLS